MSDNIVDIKSLAPKKGGIKNKILAVFSILILIALVVCIIMQTDLRFLFKKQAEDIYMAQNSIASYPVSTASSVLNEKYKNGVVVCADNSVYALNENLDTLWKKEISAAAPVMEVSGNYVMIADNGGRNYYLYNQDKTVVEKQSDSVITGASVASDGSYVLICEDSPYLGSVLLYSADGEKMYEWHSGDGYIIDAMYIRESKVLAVVTLEANTALCAQVLFFDIYQAEPIAAYRYDDTIITNVFSGGGSVYAVADNKTLGFDLTGGEKFSYDYSGRILEKCAFDSSGEIVLAFDSDGGADIVILSSKGKEESNIHVSESVNYISLDSNKVAVNGGGGILVYNLSGKHLYNIVTDRDVKDICLFKDASRFFGISSVSFDTVKIQ